MLDVDSTLSGIEGIDWLAARRGPAIAEQIRALTDSAMTGRLKLDDVYARRLDAVAPTRMDVAALAGAYCDGVAAGAGECIAALQRAGARVLLVSGGLLDALLPLARIVGVREPDVYGVRVTFGPAGEYAGYDTESPLCRDDGKTRLLSTLIDGLHRPILHVGDGMTDAVTREVVDGFAVFTGFVRRENVIARADVDVASFAALAELVLGHK